MCNNVYDQFPANSFICIKADRTQSFDAHMEQQERGTLVQNYF